MAHYKLIACNVLWRELCHFASLSPNTFDFHFLQQGLHNTPDILRSELQAAIDSTKDGYDAILIGYGLCSNGLAGIQARATRLVTVRAHDCITFLLGSKERYKEYFDSHPGTYWYSPGWIDTGTQPSKERHDKLLAAYAEQYGEENAQYLMDMEQGWFRQYSNVAYLDLGFGDSAAYRNYTKECADWLKWQYDEPSADDRLVKQFLDGEWTSGSFLVVEPGQKIAASHDDGILRIEGSA